MSSSPSNILAAKQTHLHTSSVRVVLPSHCLSLVSAVYIEFAWLPLFSPSNWYCSPQRRLLLGSDTTKAKTKFRSQFFFLRYKYPTNIYRDVRSQNRKWVAFSKPHFQFQFIWNLELILQWKMAPLPARYNRNITTKWSLVSIFDNLWQQVQRNQTISATNVNITLRYSVRSPYPIPTQVFTKKV